MFVKSPGNRRVVQHGEVFNTGAGVYEGEGSEPSDI
jgi:hypothetical protein